MITIICPWCDTAYQSFKSKCDNCGGALPLPRLDATEPTKPRQEEVVIEPIKRIFQIKIDKDLYPDRDLPYLETITLAQDQEIEAVGIITDWWQKRPTEVRVYEGENGQKIRLLGSGGFFTYLDRVCGKSFDSKCEYPDVDGSDTAQLRVDLSQPATVSELIVEVDGLLSPENEFVILKGIRIY